MEARNSTSTDRRRRLDRRRRDFPSFGETDRRTKAGRRQVSLRRRTDPPGTDSAVAHKLLPANGHRFLSPLRVVARVESEFAYVETDEAEGGRRVREIMGRLRKGHRSQHARADDPRLDHLEKVKDGAVHLRFGDDPSSEIEYLSFTVIPGEPLIVECESPEHAQAAEPLLKRCAKALGYSIIRHTAFGE